MALLPVAAILTRFRWDLMVSLQCCSLFSLLKALTWKSKAICPYQDGHLHTGIKCRTRHGGSVRANDQLQEDHKQNKRLVFCSLLNFFWVQLTEFSSSITSKKNPSRFVYTRLYYCWIPTLHGSSYIAGIVCCILQSIMNVLVLQ